MKMVKKACSRVLCCFSGRSAVYNSDELDSTAEVCHSSSKSRHRLSWSEFRTKKKNRGEVPEGDVAKNEFAVSAKKGFFRKFHKKSSSKRSHTKVDHKQQHPILSTHMTKVTGEPQKKAIRHVSSRCAARSQPALLCHVRAAPEPVKIGTSPSCPTAPKAQKRRKTRFGESGQQMVVLLMLAMTLGTMLLGGRVLAIVCTSALAYLSPFVKDMSRAKHARTVDP